MERAPVEAPPQVEQPPVALEAAISALVGLAVQVLRARSAADPARVALPEELTPEASAVVDLVAAERAEPSLRHLRALLRDIADGLEVADPEVAMPAAAALRLLLEGVLRTPLAFPGDDAPPNAREPAELEQGIAAAAPLLPDEVEVVAQNWTVRNLTARRLQLTGRDGIGRALPAFGQRTFDVDPESILDLSGGLARDEIVVEPAPPTERAEWMALLGAYFWLVPGSFVVGLAYGPLAGAGAGLLLVALAVVFALRQKRTWMDQVRATLAQAPAWVVEKWTYTVIVLIGVGLPATALVFGADLRELVRHVVALEASGDEYLTLVGRSMQLALIAIASLVPALLYFQFDRDRLSTLREKFVHQIFRLDPAMHTQRAIAAKYGGLIDEVYGPEREGRYRRLQPGRRAPIFVATLLIVLGWLYVLLNPEIGVLTDEAAIGTLFEPRRTAVGFAFLGAYFFTLFALLRGYVRRDLRPKSYTDITVRILAVTILAWVLDLGLASDSERMLLFAFVTGIVPQVALNRLREISQGVSRRRRTASGSTAAAFDDALPLTDIEGIDLYDRTRLASEGVTNIEALAHHDLVELMLQTRIPVPRLVDWTDQAILQLHVRAHDLTLLRTYGIRTATDLLSTFHSAEARGPVELVEFFGILGAPEAGKPHRLKLIVQAMEDEEWMANLRYWHSMSDI